MEATPRTIGEFLTELLPDSKLAAGLTRVVTVVEFVANQFVAGIQQVALPLCEWADRVDSAPPVPGYEAMLVERGCIPLMARSGSYGLIGLGRREVKNATKHRIVADSLRFLAKPGRRKSSISRKAAALLEVWNETSFLSGAFQGSDVSVFEFIEALEGAVRGELTACRRVAEVAAALSPAVNVRRGPKVREASMTHELLLRYVTRTAGAKSFTYDSYDEIFTDPLTRATCLAFDDPDFDPRPASRRNRKRLQQSN